MFTIEVCKVEQFWLLTDQTTLKGTQQLFKYFHICSILATDPYVLKTISFKTSD